MGGKEDPPRQARRCCYAVARSQGEERRGEGEGGREVEREAEEEEEGGVRKERGLADCGGGLSRSAVPGAQRRFKGGEATGERTGEGGRGSERERERGGAGVGEGRRRQCSDWRPLCSE